MVNRHRTFAIVGAGLAGAKAAETLRLEGFDGRIVLLGCEKRRPYERPPLSKARLPGDDRSISVHEEGFYAEYGIELRPDTRVTAVDSDAAEIVTDAGERIAYDRMLLATGAQPRRLTVPGSDLAGIHYLRTVDDADRLRAALTSATRLGVVGGGWIGCEVAATARQLGVDVTLLDAGPAPLQRVLGPEVAAVYRDLHRENGVDIRPNTSVEAFVGRQAVEGIRTTDGLVVSADVVVVGVGVEPRTELATRAGLDLDNGIVVDEHLQSSTFGIYAAGDVATAWHPHYRRGIRVEHWANALNQGVVAAKNMLGRATSYDRLPYFYSDQYDLGMEYAGHPTTWDHVAFRGDPASRQFVVFWLARGRVVAGMNANVWGVNGAIQALIRSRRVIAHELLSDPSIPLEELVAAA